MRSREIEADRWAWTLLVAKCVRVQSTQRKGEDMRKQIFAWVAVAGASMLGSGCADDSSPEPSSPVDVGSAINESPAARIAPTRFFVPPAEAAAVKQISDLVRAKHFGDALKVAALETTPRAWAKPPSVFTRPAST